MAKPYSSGALESAPSLAVQIQYLRKITTKDKHFINLCLYVFYNKLVFWGYSFCRHLNILLRFITFLYVSTYQV